MANKINAGYITTLISGSHSMMVKADETKHTPVENTPLPNRYECFWFDGVKPQKAVFQEQTIKLV